MNKEDIKHLANLSRLELSEEEVTKFTGEFDEILKYVDKIKEITGTDEGLKIESAMVKNVFREDDNVQESGEYTDKILEQAPKSRDGFVEVKKILNND